MFDIFSASGFLVHSPCGPRKSGMPESVEMPAPVSTTTRRASSIQSRTWSITSRSGHLDLAAAAHPAHARRDTALGDDDRRRGLPAELLQLLHRALDCFLGELAELLRRFTERAGADLEADRQRAGGREDLRLAHVEHGARGVALALVVDGCETANGADASVGEDLLHVEGVRIDLELGALLFGFGGHVQPRGVPGK